MQALPHVYSASAAGGAAGNVSLVSPGLPALQSAAPAQFDGPGDQWSPEALLVAAAASCFILTFRAVAKASGLPWSRVECKVDATLEREDGVMRFTHLLTRAKLTVQPGISIMLCERVLTKSEHGCLVANSLRGRRDLQIEIIEEPQETAGLDRG